MAGLNAQTAAQFQQYAAQQHPGKYLIFIGVIGFGWLSIWTMDLSERCLVLGLLVIHLDYI